MAGRNYADTLPGYVYRLFDAEGCLLYIGCSKDAEHRIRTHTHRFAKWWPQVARMTVDFYPTLEVALSAEELAIRTERPLHNRAHNFSQGAEWDRIRTTHLRTVVAQDARRRAQATKHAA